jgi:hypothetical protein
VDVPELRSLLSDDELGTWALDKDTITLLWGMAKGAWQSENAPTLSSNAEPESARWFPRRTWHRGMNGRPAGAR